MICELYLLPIFWLFYTYYVLEVQKNNHRKLGAKCSFQEVGFLKEIFVVSCQSL